MFQIINPFLLSSFKVQCSRSFFITNNIENQCHCKHNGSLHFSFSWSVDSGQHLACKHDILAGRGSASAAVPVRPHYWTVVWIQQNKWGFLYIILHDVLHRICVHGRIFKYFYFQTVLTNVIVFWSAMTINQVKLSSGLCLKLLLKSLQLMIAHTMYRPFPSSESKSVFLFNVCSSYDPLPIFCNFYNFIISSIFSMSALIPMLPFILLNYANLIPQTVCIWVQNV